jgi:hypothetical protein
MCHYVTTLLFSNTVASSGRIAGLLRNLTNRFTFGLQHDCHEALNIILQTAHEEENLLLTIRNNQNLGVVAKNFRIEEHVVLKVRVTVFFICFDCTFSPVAQPFGSAWNVMSSIPKSNLGLVFPFRSNAALLAKK